MCIDNSFLNVLGLPSDFDPVLGGFLDKLCSLFEPTLSVPFIEMPSSITVRNAGLDASASMDIPRKALLAD